MERKDFSFIIPVYNCADYIEACVSSIVNIGLSSYEIVLVDDGSTDGSGAICDRLVSELPAVRCIHQNNQGVSQARNCGLNSACGEYILFIDGDDTLDSEESRKVINRDIIAMSPDLIVFGMVFDYYNGSRVYRSDPIGYPIPGAMERDTWLSEIKKLFDSNSLSSSCNKIFKKAIIERNNLQFRCDMILYEDLEFSLRYLACCERIYCSDKLLYHYRQSQNDGNIRRRLLKIEHLSNVVSLIEDSLVNIEMVGNAEGLSGSSKEILLTLYLSMAWTKLKACPVKDFNQICDDFATWWKNHHLELLNADEYIVKMILSQDKIKILFRRTYSNIRHKIAVCIKDIRCKKACNRE